MNRAESRVRGMLLGLAVGETLGAVGGKLPAGGPLRAGVSTRLACFTAEGTIRASVRGKHKGICHPPSVVWHAYCRWAALQGIEAERMRRRWALTDRLPPARPGSPASARPPGGRALRRGSLNRPAAPPWAVMASGRRPGL